MSLQDIKQILSRIITLNKNLDENRLNTLLEASGWEKQNKDDALNIFKIDQKKNLNKMESKEISKGGLDQELAVVPKNELITEVRKENIINFIPANLPIKEDRQEIFMTDNKSVEIAEAVTIIPEKTEEKILGAKEGVDARSQQEEDAKQMSEKTKRINWVVWLAIALIIFLLAFGYMSSN